MKKILFILIYILAIFIAIKALKQKKAIKKLENKYNTCSEEAKIKKKFSKRSLVLSGFVLGLMLSSLFNMMMNNNETIVILLLLLISAIIGECLYMIFLKKSDINPEIYKDQKKLAFLFFSGANIEILLTIIFCVEIAK